MAVADIASGALLDDVHQNQLRAIIARTVGTIVEWYDFLLYGIVAGLVFGKLFFPKSDPLVGVLKAFSIFLIGFIARPIGAVVFGHFGDRNAVVRATWLNLSGLRRRCSPSASRRDCAITVPRSAFILPRLRRVAQRR